MRSFFAQAKDSLAQNEAVLAGKIKNEKYISAPKQTILLKS